VEDRQEELVPVSARAPAAASPEARPSELPGVLAGVSAAPEAALPSAPPRPPRPPAPAESSAQQQPSAASPRRPSAPGGANGAGASLPPKPPAARSAAGEGEGRQPTIYRRERSTGRIVAVVVGALVVIVLLVVLISALGSKGASTTGKRTGGTSTNARSHSSAGAGIQPRSLRVVVLNATQTNGLAAKVASTLKGDGYSQAAALFGTPKGSYPTTMVQYAEGHLSEAKGVAGTLKVASADVHPLGSEAAPLSGGAPVVVIVGGSNTGEASHEGGQAEETSSAEGEAGGETAGGGEATSGEQAAEPGA
jgi:hypothetical protein